jgi:flagellar biogenesis protein FliO
MLMMKSAMTNIANLLAHARSIGSRKQRVMQLCETLPLGERRFLLLVKVEEQKFLVGAAGNSISLLAKISPSHGSQEFQIAGDSDPSESQVCKSWK